MKNTTQLVVPQTRTRAHRVLFENGSPFKTRTVELKTRYKRKPKHCRSNPLDY